MPYLKYYDNEHKAYPYEHQYILNRDSTVLLTTHLLYQSNISGIRISFSLSSSIGNANYRRKTLKYHKSLCISVLSTCHEVAHLIDRKLNGYGGKRAHTKRHKKVVKKLIDYCRRNEYFGLKSISGWKIIVKPQVGEPSSQYEEAPTITVDGIIK